MIDDGGRRLVWRKSRYCDSGTCLEVAVHDDVVGVRHSTDPDGPILWFSRPEWTAFLAGVKAGDLTS